MPSQTSGGLIKFSFSLDAELLAKVDAYARYQHIRRSSAIRQMIVAFFEARDAAEKPRQAKDHGESAT